MRASLADVATACGPAPQIGSTAYPQWLLCSTEQAIATPTQTAPTQTAAGNISAVLSVPGPSGPYMDPAELNYVQGKLATLGIDPATATPQQIFQAANEYGNSVWAAATGGSTPANVLTASAPATGTAALTGTFKPVGYIDQQGNLWRLGASGQVGGPDVTEVGAVTALPSATQGQTQQQNGNLLLDSAAYASVLTATGSTSSPSSSTLLLLAAGAAAIFFLGKAH